MGVKLHTSKYRLFVCTLIPSVSLLSSLPHLTMVPFYWTSLVAQTVKHLPTMRETGFDPSVGKIPWRRKWQSTPGLLPGKPHGQRSLVGYSPRGRKESDTTERLHFTPFYWLLGQKSHAIVQWKRVVWDLGEMVSSQVHHNRQCAMGLLAEFSGERSPPLPVPSSVKGRGSVVILLGNQPDVPS